MITLQWWVLLLAGVGVFTLGQITGAVGLVKLAMKVDSMQKEKKISTRYPEVH